MALAASFFASCAASASAAHWSARCSSIGSVKSCCPVRAFIWYSSPRSAFDSFAPSVARRASSAARLSLSALPSTSPSAGARSPSLITSFAPPRAFIFAPVRLVRISPGAFIAALVSAPSSIEYAVSCKISPPLRQSSRFRYIFSSCEPISSLNASSRPSPKTSASRFTALRPALLPATRWMTLSIQPPPRPGIPPTIFSVAPSVAPESRPYTSAVSSSAP